MYSQNMKYHLWIIGCQYNEWDGARIKFALDKSGLVETNPNEAETIIILACAVRQTAVNRIYGKLNSWKNKKVIITGCVLKQDKKSFESKNAVVIDWEEIEKIAPRFGLDRKKLKSYLNKGNTNSVYIPITTGCNNFCSYCAVPYTRGREISRNFNDIVQEAKKLVKKGKKEIMLVGQNVNSYTTNKKTKIKNKSDFALLLKTLNGIEGNFEISFTSNHPKDMSDDVIKAVATLPKIKKEIHLPLQSGSDRILKAMNRPYTTKEYMALVKKLKSKIKNLKLTTDVIVGFPGETEEDFQKTVDIFKKTKYYQAYINKYSPRKGTAAFALGDPISWSEKQRRWHILNELIER